MIKKYSSSHYHGRHDTRKVQNWYHTKEWNNYRFRFLYHNPKCFVCGAKATVVDHIVAHKGNKQVFENTHNHMPLCAACHNTITGLFDKHSLATLEARQHAVDEKAKWIHEQRIKNNVTTKIVVLDSYIKIK